MKANSVGGRMRRQGGFTLLEVLVSIVVLAVGLLGMAALQSVSLKQNTVSYVRVQASLLADDILERMRANRSAVQTNSYNIALSDVSKEGEGLVADDINAWLQDVAAFMPGGDGSIACNNSVCVITLQWTENDSEGGGVITRDFVLTTEV